MPPFLFSTIITAVAPVAQLDRAFVFGTKGWEFEPLQGHLCSPPEPSPLLLLIDDPPFEEPGNFYSRAV